VKWLIGGVIIALAGVGAFVLFVLLRNTPPAKTSPEKTEVRLLEPFTPSGLTERLTASATVTGECQPSIKDFARDDAFRCFTEDGGILDPCFMDPYGSSGPDPLLACPQDPWASTVVQVSPTGELVQDDVERPALSEAGPWALELGNGQRCVFIGGATTTIAGMRLNYACGNGDSFVVGDPDSSRPVWRVFYAPKGSGNFVQVDVRVAWY
jgi:hypothetical protein